MNEKTIRFRLGLFVLAALILLAVLITLFGGFPTYFKQTQSFTVVFPTASGLSKGSPVKKSGVKIGEVSTIALDDSTGKVNIGIAIEQDFTLRRSDRAALVQSLLGGDAFIAFLPPEDPAKVEEHQVFVGEQPTDAGKLLQKTGELMPEAQEALLDLRKFFLKIDKVMPTIEETLKEFQSTAREFGAVAKEVKPAVPELRKSNDEILKLAKKVNETWPTIKRTAEELEVATRTWGRVGERVDVFLKGNEEPLTRTIENLQETTKRAAQLLGDDNQRLVRDILRDVSAGSKRFESLTRNAEEMMQETRITVRQGMKTLQKFDQMMTEIGKATGPFADHAPAILKNLTEGTEEFNKTIKEVRELVHAVGRSEGTLQKFLTDPSIYNNLNDSALMVTRILPRVDRILQDVEVFADRIARRPESLGVGGVIRPSSGLKEAPTYWPPSQWHR